MDDIKELLLKRMNQHHLGSEAIASQVCYSINQIAEGRFEAIRYKNGVLTVTVPSSSAASDLQGGMSALKIRLSQRVSPNRIIRIIIKTK
ncbi:MAG: hypothetical protein WC773_03625 [Patescibacteria group bacterium]|jgi:hypothetical protein